MVKSVADYIVALWKHSALFSSMRGVSWMLGAILTVLTVGTTLNARPDRLLYAGISTGTLMAFLLGNFRLYHSMRREILEDENRREFRIISEEGNFSVSRDAHSPIPFICGTCSLTCKSPSSAATLVFKGLSAPQYPYLALADFRINGARMTGSAANRNGQQRFRAGETRIIQVAFRLEGHPIDSGRFIDPGHEFDIVLKLDHTHWETTRDFAVRLKRTAIYDGLQQISPRAADKKNR